MNEGARIARSWVGAVLLLVGLAGDGSAALFRDLDGDGRTDILLRDRVPLGSPPATVNWRIIPGNGDPVINGPAVITSDAHIVGYGDFGGTAATAEILFQYKDDGALWATNVALGVWRNFVSLGDEFIEVVAVGDFDGSGTSDVMVREELTGKVYVYLTDAMEPIPYADTGEVMGLSLLAIGVADFDGDGRDDVLWRHQEGEEQKLRIWYMDGASATILNKDRNLLGSFEPFDFYRILADDFDGDGVGDLLLRDGLATDPSGHTTLLRMTNWRNLSPGNLPDSDEVLTLTQPTLWRAALGGDRDGDGLRDLSGVMGDLESGWLLGAEIDTIPDPPEGHHGVPSIPASPYVTGDVVWERERPLTTRRFKYVTDYRFSGNQPWDDTSPGDPRWSPAQMVEILQAYPDDWYVYMGTYNARPVGHADHDEVGAVVAGVHAEIDGLSISAAEKKAMKARLVFGFRADVFAKRIDTDPKCDGSCGWGGTMATPVFDTDWILHVPKSEHRWAMDGLWGSDPAADPLCGSALYEAGVDQCTLNPDTWPSYLDRAAMITGVGPDSAPALYAAVAGSGAPGDPHHARVSGVVMDLRDPDYRAWSAARLVANLAVWGVEPGEPAVIQVASKPGFHTYFPGDTPGGANPVAESHMWTGPQHPNGGLGAGPILRTPYAAGEFEEAMSLLLQDLRDGLVAAGYPDVKLATAEAPAYVRTWRNVHPTVRRAPWLLGERARTCNETDYPDPPSPANHAECPVISYPGP